MTDITFCSRIEKQIGLTNGVSLLEMLWKNEYWDCVSLTQTRGNSSVIIVGKFDNYFDSSFTDNHLFLLVCLKALFKNIESVETNILIFFFVSTL